MEAHHHSDKDGVLPRRTHRAESALWGGINMLKTSQSWECRPQEVQRECKEGHGMQTELGKPGSDYEKFEGHSQAKKEHDKGSSA